MLVLTRKLGERIVIDNRIVVAITKIHGKAVQVGIEAPADVPIRREELPLIEEGGDPAKKAG